MIKLFIFSILISMPIIGIGQTTNFTVKGKIGIYNAPAKAYLDYYVGDKNFKDSATLINGAFQFKGNIEDPVYGDLYINSKGNGSGSSNDYISIAIDKGVTYINSADSAKHAAISGTKLAEEFSVYNNKLKTISAAWEAYGAKESSVTSQVSASDAFRKQHTAEYDAILHRRDDIDKEFIETHPGSFLSLYILDGYTWGKDYVQLQPLFDNLSPEIKTSAGGKEYAARLLKCKNVALGKTAPDFTMPDTSGKMVALSSLKGKYILIDFWASWCGPCRHENPNLVMVYNQFKDKNFTILGVSLDDTKSKDKWLAAIHQDGLKWTQVSDLMSTKTKAYILYGGDGIPANFLLDPNGKIIGKYLHGYDLVDKLNEVLPIGKKNLKAE